MLLLLAQSAITQMYLVYQHRLKLITVLQRQNFVLYAWADITVTNKA